MMTGKMTDGFNFIPLYIDPECHGQQEVLKEEMDLDFVEVTRNGLLLRW